MAFDPSTAVLAEDTQKPAFDPSTATLVEEPSQQSPAFDPSTATPVEEPAPQTVSGVLDDEANRRDVFNKAMDVQRMLQNSPAHFLAEANSLNDAGKREDIGKFLEAQNALANSPAAFFAEAHAAGMRGMDLPRTPVQKMYETLGFPQTYVEKPEKEFVPSRKLSPDEQYPHSVGEAWQWAKEGYHDLNKLGAEAAKEEQEKGSGNPSLDKFIEGVSSVAPKVGMVQAQEVQSWVNKITSSDWWKGKPDDSAIKEPGNSTVNKLTDPDWWFGRENYREEPPVIKSPEIGSVANISSGVQRSAAKTFNFFVSPEGVALLGTSLLSEDAQRAVAGAFSLQMAKQVPEQIVSLAQSKNSSEVAERALDLVTSSGFMLMAAKHATAESSTAVNTKEVTSDGNKETQTQTQEKGNEGVLSSEPAGGIESPGSVGSVLEHPNQEVLAKTNALLQEGEGSQAPGDVAPLPPPGEPKSDGPGAAHTSEFPEQKTTGLKKAVVKDERLAKGLEDLPPAEREAEEPRVQRAEDAVDNDPELAGKLVGRIVDEGNHAISPDDAAVMLVERNRLMNERRSLEAEYYHEETSPERKAVVDEKLAGNEVQTERLDKAQRAAGSAWGRTGHMYQRLIREDYTLEAMESRMRKAKDAPLSTEERGKLAEMSDTITDLHNRVEASKEMESQLREQADLTRVHEATIKDLQDQVAKAPKYGKEVFDIAHGIVNRWKTEADASRKELRKLLFGSTNIGVDPRVVLHVAKIMRAHIGELGLNAAESGAKLVAEFGETVRPYLAKAWDRAQKDIDSEKAGPKVKDVLRKPKGEQTPVDIKARAKAEAVAGEELSHKTVYDLARSHINAGVHGEDAVMKAVHSDIKEAYPDASERDIRRAFSEYGKAKFPSKEADLKELSELRNLTRLQESIDRLKAGQDALKTGMQRDKATQLIREKQAQLNELLKKRQGPPSPEKLATSLEARKTALRNRLEDLNKQLETGEKPPANTPPGPLDDEGLQLKADIEAVKTKLAEIEDAANPPKTDAEKQVEQLSKVKAKLDEVFAGTREQAKSKPFDALSKAADDIHSEIAHMRAWLEQWRRDALPPTDKNAAKEKAQINAMERAIQKYDEKTAKGKFSAEDKGAPRPDTEKVAALREIRDARKAVYDAAKKAQRPVLTPEERYNAVRQKAIAKQLAEVKMRMATGKYVKDPKPPMPAKNAETRKAEVDLATEKGKFNQWMMDYQQANRTRFQKATAWVAGFTRANVLGHISVLEHLGGAAVENLVTRPIGSAVAQLFRLNRTLNAIRKKAVYEGGWGGEMKGASATLKSLGAAWQKIRYGKSELDWLHDSGKVYPKGVMEFVGGVHAAIKEPVRQGIYARAMELGMKAAEERGLDPRKDEVLYKAISKDAYDVANMDIFMGDNFLTKKLHHLVTGSLRGDKDNPGLAMLTADVLDVLFPVVNAPTNIAIRKMRLVVGLPEAAVRLRQSAKRGELANDAMKLSPRDAELITRAFKYGIVGAAAGVYAWTHANQFGGIQALGQQAPRDKSTGLAPGDIALPGGATLSHHLAHGPLGGHMNMIADARRIYDKGVENGGNEWTQQGEVAFFMMFSAFKDIPMMTTVGRLTSPLKSAGQKAGEMMKNMFVFGAIQDVARATDTDSEGMPVKREANTFVDQIKTAIPGLRQQVPEKEVKRTGPKPPKPRTAPKPKQR